MSNPTSLAAIGTDPDAFEAFYREHVEAVQRFVARRVGDPHTAADLTAEIFLAVIEAGAGYRSDRGSPRAWIFGIARNVVSTEHRRRTRQATAFTREGGRRVLAPDAIERATERMDAEREARSLQGRLGALTPQLRAVFELVAVDQLSVADAAAVLDITPGNARVRLHRARTALGVALLPTPPRPLDERTPS